MLFSYFCLVLNFILLTLTDRTTSTIAYNIVGLTLTAVDNLQDHVLVHVVVYSVCSMPILSSMFLFQSNTAQ